MRFRDKLIVITAAVERFAMAGFFLFLLAVAERTFKQRLFHLFHLLEKPASMTCIQFGLICVFQLAEL